MTEIALSHGVVRICPYQAEWPRLFEEEARRLRAPAECCGYRMEHIGSTAVPGLVAKPIIDIMMAVPDLPPSPDLTAALERSGYTHRGDGGVPGRAYFVKAVPECRTHHLNLCVEGSRFWMATIVFRDHLRASATDLQRYAQLKTRLAEAYAGDRPGYTQAKSSFIAEILRAHSSGYRGDGSRP